MNHLKLYIKQSWNLMKQNKLFTGIYVTGTALAIATTMIMAIVYYVKIAPVYPEVNRDRTLYLEQSIFVDNKYKGTNSHFFSTKALEEWFYPLKNVEAVSAELSMGGQELYIQPMNGRTDFPVAYKFTDSQFFRIYPFRFVEGKPITEADMQSGIQIAVITEELARRLFGKSTDVVGQTVSMANMEYRVVGVVESASVLTPKAFAQIYVPYSSMPGYNRTMDTRIPHQGPYQVTFLLKSADDEEALRQEIAEIVHKYNHSQTGWELKIFEQPFSHTRSVFQGNVDTDFSWSNVIRKYLLIVFVLLLVPALNLCGLIAGRMDVRISEMAIRKSFGASKTKLLNQVVCENLLMTLLGGLIGMVLSWIALVVSREWIFSLFDNPTLPIAGISTEVTGEMLFAPSIFLAALLLCVTLNLLSALIPAWLSLRKPIIQSMNEKR